MSEEWIHNYLLNFKNFLPNFSWEVKIKGLSKKIALFTSSDLNVCLKMKKAILKEHITYVSFAQNKRKRKRHKEKDTLKCTLKDTLKWERNIFKLQ